MVNPHAGGGKGRRHWTTIKECLEQAGLSFEFACTEFKYHAVQLTVEAIARGYRRFVAVGGDGTLNEVVNGMFIQQDVPTDNFRLAVVAVGTGNDWLRMFGHPRDYQQQAQIIADGHLFWQDVGVVEYHSTGVPQKRYFVNSAGCGFEADVVSCTNRLKDAGRKGVLLYIFSLLRVLFGHRSAQMQVQVDDSTVSSCATFSLTAGIGRYTGGGMRQAPFASANDGLFDVTIIRRMSKLNVLFSLHRLYNGTVLDHSKISGQRGVSVRVESEPAVNVEADGESLGQTPMSLSLKPLALAIVVNHDFVKSSM